MLFLTIFRERLTSHNIYLKIKVYATIAVRGPSVFQYHNYRKHCEIILAIYLHARGIDIPVVI